MRLRDHVKVVAVDAETAKGFDSVSLFQISLSASPTNKV